MKTLKKILLIIIAFVISSFVFGIKANASDEEPLTLSNGNGVTYSGTQIKVTIPTEYDGQNTYFRAIWVTPLAGNLSSCSNVTINTYKEEIMEMFEVMEYYNLNALIYHIRIMNDALYDSKLNPKSSFMTADEDVLSWVIDECHKRGIEFHAWMNPYRIASSGVTDLEATTAAIKAKCPSNIGSNVDNLLMNSTGGVILNPGLPEVRKFIVDTCMEVIENYDVDAIHFDDYFYISDVDDSSTQAKYNTTGMNSDDWRRLQVDTFILDLSTAMRNYNKANNRYVQLGISPSGIYRNGDGVVTYDDNGNAITNGSKTNGFAHYGNYLFSDTLKWINEEWIDYIIPQSYWGFSHPSAGYADVMSWWNSALKYKKCNLYSGMGIYMSENPGSNYSWGFDPSEAPNQVLYCTTLSKVEGTVFYNYDYLKYAYEGDKTSLYGRGLLEIKSEMFTNPVVLPVIKTLGIVDIDPVTDLKADVKSDSTTLTFKSVNNAKFYVIYRSNEDITCDKSQVYKIIGNDNENGVVTFVDEEANGKKYNYAVCSQSPTNNLSTPSKLNLITFNVEFKDLNNQTLSTQTVYYGERAVAPSAPEKENATFIGWSRDFDYVTKDLVITPKYTDSDFIVTFYNADMSVAKVENVKYLGNATAPIVTKTGFTFVSWDKEFSNISKDIDVYPIFELKMCTVRFVDWDGTELLTYQIKYGKAGWCPENPSRRAYTFIGWSDELTSVTDNITVEAVYEPIMLTITYISGIDNSIIKTEQIIMYSSVTPPTPPVVEGYIFRSWFGNTQELNYNAKIKAMYMEIEYQVTILDKDDNVLVEEFSYFLIDGYTMPDAPKVDGYSFIKWDHDINHLGNDESKITIRPIYCKNEFTVKVLGDNDVILQEKVYHPNEEIVYPEAPKVNGKDFVGWSIEPSDIYDDTIVKAIYENNSFTLTFLGDNDELITTTTYNKDDKLSYPNPPVVEGRTFIKWDKDLSGIKTDTTIKAIYTTINVTYVGYDDKVIETKPITGNSTDYYPELPIIVGYKCIGWSENLDNITSDVICKAIYEEASVKVTYYDYYGMEIANEIIPYGDNASFIDDIPSVDNYRFIGYDNDGLQIIKDTDIYLMYEKKSGCESFVLTKIMSGLSLLGLIIFIKKKH